MRHSVSPHHLLALLTLIAPSSSTSATPTLAPHPRLRVTDVDLSRLEKRIATDVFTADVATGLHDYGASLINEPLVNCTRTGVENSLLAQARAVLDRTYTLALLYRLEKNETFAKRAIKEMLHVTADAACSSWNPAHFLDTAEMMHAVAVGYDWLYNAPPTVFTATDKATILDGLADRGLQAAADSWNNVEFTTVYNWNLVCNGGMIAAALTLMDSTDKAHAALASAVFTNATSRIRKSLMQTYGPDGAWPEGPTYWGYATKYALMAIEVLKSATGDAQGLDDAPGFSNTGMFRIHGTSPLDGKFNWGDSDSAGLDEFLPNFFGLASASAASASASSALLSTAALASHSKTYAYFGQQIFGRSRPLKCSSGDCALTLIDSKYAEGAAKDLTSVPTCASFRLQDSGWDNKTALGYFRSDWRGTQWNTTTTTAATAQGPTSSSSSDVHSGGVGGGGLLPKKPVWIGFKGGNGQSNHNDLDAGTFVFEMEGHRWAVDLGADSYGLSGYWDKSAAAGKRYSYYRKSTVGHNTLTFNANDLHPGWSAQDPHSVAAISTFACSGSGGGKSDGSESGSESSVSDTDSDGDSDSDSERIRSGRELKSVNGVEGNGVNGSNEPHAVVDLTPVYAKAGGPHPPQPATSKVIRGFSLMQSSSRIIVSDEWEAQGATNMTWSMHYREHDVRVVLSADKRTATLTAVSDDGAAIVATVDSQHGVFDVVTPVILPPQEPVADLRKLVVVITDTKAVTSLQVSFAIPGTPPPPATNLPSLWSSLGVRQSAPSSLSLHL